MKKLLTILAVLGLVATGAYADIRNSANWEGSYEATILPDHPSEGWAEVGAPNGTITNGVLSLSNTDGDWNGYINDGVFAPIEENGFSYEIRFKLSAEPTDFAFYNTYASVNSTLQFRNDGSGPFVRVSIGTIADSTFNLHYSIDPTVMHTYRVTVVDVTNPNWIGAKLYVDDNPIPVAEATNNAAGGWNPWGSSKMDIYPRAGSTITTSIDWIRWTANGAYEPVPEPMTLSLLGFGGVLAFLRRR